MLKVARNPGATRSRAVGAAKRGISTYRDELSTLEIRAVVSRRIPRAPWLPWAYNFSYG
jgi:hypothetical protein